MSVLNLLEKGWNELTEEEKQLLEKALDLVIIPKTNFVNEFTGVNL